MTSIDKLLDLSQSLSAERDINRYNLLFAKGFSDRKQTLNVYTISYYL